MLGMSPDFCFSTPFPEHSFVCSAPLPACQSLHSLLPPVRRGSFLRLSPRRLCAVRGTSEEAQGSSLAEGFPKICFPPTPPDCSLKSRSEEPGCSHWENGLEKRLGLAVALQHPTFLQSHT